ncbi:MAG: hypothetical protein FVQ84_02355 [Planctomycetes bacterium]|nr:hypothetical protein [Planctomycetota bacterium]
MTISKLQIIFSDQGLYAPINNPVPVSYVRVRSSHFLKPNIYTKVTDFSTQSASCQVKNFCKTGQNSQNMEISGCMTMFILPSVNIWQSEEDVKVHKPLQLTALQIFTSVLLKWVSSMQYLYKYWQSPVESSRIRFLERYFLAGGLQ